FFSSRRRHTRSKRDWSSDVCSSDLGGNRVMDMSSEAQLYLNSAAETETKLIEVQTQLQVAEMMRSSLEPDNSELLPSNMGLENEIGRASCRESEAGRGCADTVRAKR